MRVAWLSAEPMTQGAMGVTGRLDMVRELMVRGHDVHVVCAGSDGDRPFDDVPTALIATTRLPFAGWASQWPRLAGAMEALPRRPHILVTDVPLLPPALLWARRRGVRVVLDIRSQPVEAGPVRTSVQRARFAVTLRLLAGRVDAVTAVSHDLLEVVTRHARFPEDRALVWRAGCRWCDEAPPDTGPPPQWPSAFAGSFVALYHGSLTAGRGVMACVEAVARCRDLDPPVGMVLLGSGGMAEELRSRALALGSADRVAVLDPVSHDRVPAFIRSADVGLVPLPPGPTWEVNWPVKLVEYLSLGLPVVLTDIRPHRVLPRDASFAYWCGTGTADEIERALRLAHEQRGQAADLRAAAEAWAGPRLGWRGPAEVFDALLRSLVGTGSRELVAP